MSTDTGNYTRGLGGWVTNDPEAAKILRAADRRYERAKIMAQGLPLGAKVEAYRVAKETRLRDYAKAGQ